jgi:hypothetical protein
VVVLVEVREQGVGHVGLAKGRIVIFGWVSLQYGQQPSGAEADWCRGMGASLRLLVRGSLRFGWG